MNDYEMPNINSPKPEEKESDKRLSPENAEERYWMLKVIIENLIKESSEENPEMLTRENFKTAENFLDELEHDARREDVSMNMLTKKTLDFMNRAGIGLMNLIALCMIEGPNKTTVEDFKFFLTSAQKKLEIIKNSAELHAKENAEKNK